MLKSARRGTQSYAGNFQVSLTPETGSITLLEGFDQLWWTKTNKLVTLVGVLLVDSVSSPTGIVTCQATPASSFSLFESQTNVVALQMALGLTVDTQSYASINSGGQSLFIGAYLAGAIAPIGDRLQANSEIDIHFMYYSV